MVWVVFKNNHIFGVFHSYKKAHLYAKNELWLNGINNVKIKLMSIEEIYTMINREE